MSLIATEIRKGQNKPAMSSFCVHCGAWFGELGLEPTPELYTENIVSVFRELGRILHPTGVVFLNIGDSYAGSGGPGSQYDNKAAPKYKDGFTYYKNPNRNVGNLKAKDMVGIPWMLAFALRNDGWWLRSDVIWHKLNPMPESVNGWRWERHRLKVNKSDHATEHNIKGGHKKMLEDASVHQGINPEWLAEYVDCPGCDKCSHNDGLVLRKGSWRPTKSHEYVFMLAKSEKYFADGEAVKEALQESSIERADYGWDGVMVFDDNGKETYRSQPDPVDRMGKRWAPPSGRNLRSVWTIATAPYKGAHFATFPPGLVKPCIESGTSERGCCPECGAPWARVIKKGYKKHENWFGDKQTVRHNRGSAGDSYYELINTNTLGWRPTCNCHEALEKSSDFPRFSNGWFANNEHAIPIPCTVFDPFIGSGTTLQVARALGRNGVGLDLSGEYLQQARKRLSLDKLAAWQNGPKEVQSNIEGLPLFGEMEGIEDD
jgi:DNA modification methylase